MAYNLKEIQLLREASLESPLEKPSHSAENVEGPNSHSTLMKPPSYQENYVC